MGTSFPPPKLCGFSLDVRWRSKPPWVTLIANGLEDTFMRWALAAIASIALASANAMAEETVKVGLILPVTGPFTTTGKQVEAGARFYMQQNGATVDGR